jgi:hypothetical protein
VPRHGVWRAWGTIRAGFERALAYPADPAITGAGIASEHRRSPDHVRVTVALAVAAADVAGAVTVARDAFTDAAGDDLAGTSPPPQPRSSPARVNRSRTEIVRRSSPAASGCICDRSLTRIVLGDRVVAVMRAAGGAVRAGALEDDCSWRTGHA